MESKQVKMINILVLSAGTRNKIIQYVKKALTGKDGEKRGNIIATDMRDVYKRQE